MSKPDRHQQAPTPVRLPDELKKELKKAAAANDRSLNGEIVNRLRSTLNGKHSQQPIESKGQQ